MAWPWQLFSGFLIYRNTSHTVLATTKTLVANLLVTKAMMVKIGLWLIGVRLQINCQPITKWSQVIGSVPDLRSVTDRLPIYGDSFVCKVFGATPCDQNALLGQQPLRSTCRVLFVISGRKESDWGLVMWLTHGDVNEPTVAIVCVLGYEVECRNVQWLSSVEAYITMDHGTWPCVGLVNFCTSCVETHNDYAMHHVRYGSWQWLWLAVGFHGDDLYR